MGYWKLFLILAVFCGIELVLSFKCDESVKKFRCGSGECLSNMSRCNFVKDCEDGSDEIGCVRPECENSKFQCKNGRCIPQHWLCDEADDCYDNSDENSTMCDNHVCPEDHYQCKGTSTCVLNSWLCDGERDCPNGDDEEGCKENPCSDMEYRCADGECIDIAFKCDGEKDCSDGSDEKDCHNVICTDDEFQCTTKVQCIPITWRCDNIADCADETDEANCTSKPPICSNHYFACTSGFVRCIPNHWKCDGNPDCTDKSDELECDNIIPRCSYGEFHCHNKRQCIPLDRKCDGVRDCVDSSDEKDCPMVQPSKSKCPVDTHYRCPGDQNICIANHQFCDHRNNCPGGEDEKRGPHFCDYNECEEMNGNCSHICNNLRIGYECACPPGYRLGEDGKTCEDINECEFDFPQCSQVCINEIGSFKCLCWTGYEMQLETGVCKATGAQNDTSLIIADFNKIHKVNLHRKPLIEQVLTVSSVSSIALHISEDHLYWADPKQETISRIKMSSSTPQKEVILKEVLKEPSAIAVDWIHKHLYWADRSYETLSVSNLDGSYPKTLVTFYDLIVNSIAVHPSKGYIFICITDHKIKRCGLDGKDCRDIADAQFATDIAIDYAHDHIYWADESLQTITAANLDGKVLKVRYFENFQPFILAVFAGQVYWSEVKQRNLFSTNITIGNLKVVAKDIHVRTGIEVLHSKAQTAGVNHCTGSLCKYLCLPRVNGSSPSYSCSCPDGYVPKLDDKTDCRLSLTTTTRRTSTVTISLSPRNKPTLSTTAASIGSSPEGLSIGTRLAIAVGTIAIVVMISVMGCYVYRWYKRRCEHRSMNFNNPIYRKVTSSASTNVDDRSMHSSAGDISNPDSINADADAVLVMNEEVPGGSHQFGTLSFGPKQVGYSEVPTNNYEINHHGNSL